MTTINPGLLSRSIACGCLLLFAHWCKAQAPRGGGIPPKGSSAYNSIQKACRDVTAIRNEVTAWWNANKDSKPALTIPPATVLDCSECGVEGHHTPNNDKIDAYVQQLGQPELGYIQKLGNAITEAKKALGTPPNLGNIPLEFGECAMEMDVEGMFKMMQELTKRIFDTKVLPSYDKFGSNKQYTWALVVMLSYYSKTYTYIVGYTEGNISSAAGTTSLDDDNYLKLRQADKDAMQLISDYYTYYLDQLYKSHHYNLYPNLIWVGREYLMTGNNDYTLENDVYGYINRGISFMHFTLKVEFEETSPVYHYKLKGEANVRCRLSMDTTESCYLFEGMSRQGLTQKMEDVAFTIPDATADYTGPKQADNPFIIRMNLCEGAPMLHLIFTGFGIAGTMLVHTPAGAMTSPAPFHPLGYFVHDLATAEKRLDDQQALADDFKANKDKYKAAMMEWSAHRGDPGFAQTPQGKKDWALILQFQHQTGIQTPFLNGVSGTPPPAPTNAGNNKVMTFDMPLRFASDALDYTNSVTLGDIQYKVKITMTQKNDPSDNLSPPKAPPINSKNLSSDLNLF